MNTEVNNMDEAKRDKYADAIVNGVIPEQESYTFREVYELVNLVAVWAAEQIDHAKGEMLIKEPLELATLLEYKTPQDALAETSNTIEEVMDETTSFVRGYFASPIVGMKE